MNEVGEGIVLNPNQFELPVGLEKQKSKYLEIKKNIDQINLVSKTISEKLSAVEEDDLELLNIILFSDTGIEPLPNGLEQQAQEFRKKYAELLNNSAVTAGIGQIRVINSQLTQSLNTEVWNGLKDGGENFFNSIDYGRVFIELQKTKGDNLDLGSIQRVCQYDVEEIDAIGKDPQSSGFDNAYLYVHQVEKLSGLYEKYKPFIMQSASVQNKLSENEVHVLEQTIVSDDTNYIETKVYTILGVPAGEISQLSLGTRFKRMFLDSSKRDEIIQHPNLARSMIEWIQKEYQLHSESPLTPEIQKQIYEKVQAQKIQPEIVDKAKSQEQLVVEGIVERYKMLVGGDLNHRDIINSDVDRKFIDSVIEIFSENRFSLVELRLLQSDLMALYYIAVGGGDTKLMQDWENKSGQKVIELPLKQQQELFTHLQSEFFNNYHNRTKEIDFVNSGLDLPSIGMELEHQELIGNLTNEYYNIQLFEKMLSGEESFDLKKLDIEIIEKIMLEFGKNIGLKDECSYLQILDHITTSNSQIKDQFRTYLAEYSNKIKLVLNIKSGEDESQQLKNIEEAKKQTGIRTMDLNPVMPWKEYWDREYPEYAGHATLNPVAAMREQYLMIKSGLLQNADTVHFTVSGDLLDPEDMDFFEVRMLLTGGSYLSTPISSEEYEFFALSGQEENYGEKFVKASKIKDKYYVIPYHRVRQLDKNRTAFELTPYANQDEFAVEFRSFKRINIDVKNIRSYVRSGTFIWLAAVGKKYSKIPVQNRTQQQQEIAKSWENLMSKWKGLKDSEKIKTPDAKELCVDVSDEYSMALQDEDYSKAKKIIKNASRTANIYKLNISKSSANAEFKTKCRKLIFEYSNSVKNILGL